MTPEIKKFVFDIDEPPPQSENSIVPWLEDFDPFTADSSAGGAATEDGGAAEDDGGAAEDDGGGAVDDGGGAADDGGGAAEDGGGAASDGGGAAHDGGGAANNGGATANDGGATANEGGATAHDGGAATNDGGAAANGGGDNPTRVSEAGGAGEGGTAPGSPSSPPPTPPTPPTSAPKASPQSTDAAPPAAARVASAEPRNLHTPTPKGDLPKSSSGLVITPSSPPSAKKQPAAAKPSVAPIESYPNPSFSESFLDKIREDAYNSGFQAGKKAAISEHELINKQSQQNEQQEKQRLDNMRNILLQDIAQQITALEQRLDEHSVSREAGIVRLTLAIMERLFPSFARRYGKLEIVDFASTFGKMLNEDDTFVLELPEEARDIESHIRQSFKAVKNFSISYNAELMSSECKLLWKDGKIERRLDIIWREIADTVRSSLENLSLEDILATEQHNTSP